MRRLLLLFSLVLVVQSCASVKKRELRLERKTEHFNRARNLVDSKKFTFVAQRLFPVGGPSIDLTNNPNDVVIKGDSITVYLPFFGERYFASTRTNEGGFKIENGLIENYKEINGEKNKMIIRFQVRDDQDLLNFQFTVFSLSSATLDVTSTSRSFISYQGRISENAALNE